MGEGELEARSHELLDVGALHVLRLLDLGNLEDVDRGKTGTVARSHVLVQRLGGLSTGERTELLVHVVGARARVVSQPNGEVLDLEGLLLVDLLKSMQRHKKVRIADARRVTETVVDWTRIERDVERRTMQS